MGRDLFSFFSGSVFFSALFVGPSIAFCFWFRLGDLFFVFLFFCSFALFAYLFSCFSASFFFFSFFCFLFFLFLLFCFASLLCCFFVFLFPCFSALVLYHHVWCKSNFFHLCNVPIFAGYFYHNFFAGQYLPCFLEFHQILVRQSQSYPHFPIISHYMPLYWYTTSNKDTAQKSVYVFSSHLFPSEQRPWHGSFLQACPEIMSMEVVGSADPEDRLMRVLSQAAWAAVAWRFCGGVIFWRPKTIWP